MRRGPHNLHEWMFYVCARNRSGLLRTVQRGVCWGWYKGKMLDIRYRQLCDSHADKSRKPCRSEWRSYHTLLPYYTITVTVTRNSHVSYATNSHKLLYYTDCATRVEQWRRQVTQDMKGSEWGKLLGKTQWPLAPPPLSRRYSALFTLLTNRPWEINKEPWLTPDTTKYIFLTDEFRWNL